MTRKNNPDSPDWAKTPNRDPALAQFELIDARIETLDQKLIGGLEKLAASVDGLAVQMAQLTGQVKQTNASIDKLAQNIERQSNNIDRLTEAVNGHLKVAESQSANITELSKLVATQAATVDFLIRRSA